MRKRVALVMVWAAATTVWTMASVAKRPDEVVRSPATVEYTVGLIVIDPDTHAIIV